MYEPYIDPLQLQFNLQRDNGQRPTGRMPFMYVLKFNEFAV